MKNKPNIIGISGKSGSGKNLIASIIQHLIWHKQVENKEKALGSYSINDFIANKTMAYAMSGWEQKAFATKVKEILCLLTGCTMKDLENEKFKSSYMSKEWDNKVDLKGNTYDRITYRQGLQLIGTDLFRDKFHKNTWINALFADYRTDFKAKTVEEWGKDLQSNWIISDTRFLNEVKAIKDRGGIIIRVNRIVCPNCGESENLHWPHVGTNPDYLCNECGKFWQLDSHDSETALDDYKDFDFVIDNSNSIEELIEKVKEILIKEQLL